jgi:hypothetical protein
MPIVQGLVASVVAIIIVLAWLAIGSVIIRPNPADDEILPVGAILTGSAVTSFSLALAAAAGLVRTGTVAVAVVCIILILIHRREVAAFVRAIH